MKKGKMIWMIGEMKMGMMVLDLGKWKWFWDLGKWKWSENWKQMKMIIWIWWTILKWLVWVLVLPEQLIYGFLSCCFRKFKSSPIENLIDKYVWLWWLMINWTDTCSKYSLLVKWCDLVNFWNYFTQPPRAYFDDKVVAKLGHKWIIKYLVSAILKKHSFKIIVCCSIIPLHIMLFIELLYFFI